MVEQFTLSGDLQGNEGHRLRGTMCLLHNRMEKVAATAARWPGQEIPGRVLEASLQGIDQGRIGTGQKIRERRMARTLERQQALLLHGSSGGSGCRCRLIRAARRLQSQTYWTSVAIAMKATIHSSPICASGGSGNPARRINTNHIRKT